MDFNGYSGVLAYYEMLKPDEIFELPDDLLFGDLATTLSILEEYYFNNMKPCKLRTDYHIDNNIRNVVNYLKIIQ